MPDLDLPRHAADKVKRALDDVLQLTSDPGDRLRIALMAASVPIGAASGFLAGISRREGGSIEQAEAVAAILDILKNRFMKGDHHDTKRTQSWEVTVSINGDQVLTIGHNHLSSVENINDYEDAIRNCAQHLLSFIGNGVCDGEAHSDAITHGTCEDSRIKKAGFTVCGSNGNREWHWRDAAGVWHDHYESGTKEGK